ncbi:uncharacterized protein LOC135711810 [Ochlerotatus camptorhynchus]|uniref:uncharacterized protein LOC135711810 n=1 Tax=Ochlerotatus camptorhynchus TaxID=644619 RepID=UPI0031CE10BD
MDIKSACFLLLCIPLACAKFKSPTDPQFSDDETDYDSPNGIDYYDVKDHPMLKGEWESYRKIKPGGLLSNSGPSGSQKNTVAYDSRSPMTTRPTGRLRKINRCKQSTPIPRTALPNFTTTKLPWRRERGRIIIDGSDPNTDLSKIMKQARQPTRASKATPRLTMRDIVGNEIKPETATNRFLVMGTVRGCREVKRETHEHIFKNTVASNPNPTIAGLTAEIPPEITYSITHQFESLPTGGKEFRFQTTDDDHGYIKLRWYSCPARRTG